MKKVLLIDDDKINNFLSSLIIKKTKKGEVAKECFNGKEGLEYLKSLKDMPDMQVPDIIFLDLNMPVLDGWQFLQEYINSDFPNKIPVYILTSSNYQADMEKSKDFDVVKGYIVKPLKKDVVEEILAQ
jgi:CheY-like chemotaxis protein